MAAVTAALVAAFSVLASGAPLAAQETRPGSGGEEIDLARGPDRRASPATLELAIPLRQSFTLLDTSLGIEIVGDAPGELRIVRAGGGRVRVHTLAAGGIAAASMGRGLGPGADLRLISLEARRVLYLVQVPSRTLVRVRLPGRRVPESLGILQEVATYRWDG